MTDEDEKAETIIAQIFHFGRNRVSVVLYNLRSFSASGLGTFSIFLTLSFLLVTTTLSISQSIFNPFSNLSLLYSVIFSVIATFFGHYHGIHLSQDGRWKLIVFFAPIFFGILLFLLAIGILEIAPSNQFIGVFGYSVILQISLLAGILSGEMENANWLGHALFMRHINSKLPGMGIKYLHWDSEGKLSLVESRDLNPRWSESVKTIACRIADKEIPFSHFTPVFYENKKISSAQFEVSRLFENLTVTWKDAMSKYQQSIKHGEVRTSWLNLVQITIPTNPLSITVQNSKIPVKSQRVKIDDEYLILAWPLPNLSWYESNRTIFKSNLDAPALHSILMTESDYDSILDIEREIAMFGNPDLANQNVRANVFRSYTNLMLLLFGNLSQSGGNRSELSKFCIRSTSKWYKSLISEDTLFEISKLNAFSEHKSLLNYIAIDEWSLKFNDAITDPTSLFLSLHDKLLNLIAENNHPKEITACMQSVLYSCTKEVIISNSRSPIEKSTQKSSYGSRREFGVNRKGIILSSICKMNLIYSLISTHSGGGN